MENKKSQSNEKKETQNKRMIAVCILDILSKRVGSSEKLTYDDIITELKRYGIDARRKAIHENIDALLDLQDPINNDRIKPLFQIEYDTKTRVVNGKEQEIHTNFRMEDPLQEYRLTDGELLMLVGYIQNNKSMDFSERADLIAKLEKCAQGKPDHSHIGLVENEESMAPIFGFLYRIKEINKAIINGKQIVFQECEYMIDTDSLTPECPDTPEIISKKIIFNPYRIVGSQGKIYLIGSKENDEELCHYRIDKITNVKIADTTVVPLTNFEWKETYLNEHPFMNAGEKVPAKLYVREKSICKVIDEFGTNLKISVCEDENPSWKDYWIVEFEANEEDLFRFVLTNSDVLEIIQPLSIRREIVRISADIDWSYRSMHDDLYTESVYLANRRGQLSLEWIDLSERDEHKNVNVDSARFVKNNLSDIRFLMRSGYCNLYSLDIIDNPVENGEYISALSKLRHLTLVKTKIKDISFLKNCPELRTLTLIDNPINDYSALYDLHKLRLLTIGKEECNMIDLQKLESDDLEIKFSSSEKYIPKEPPKQKLAGRSTQKVMQDIVERQRPKKETTEIDGRFRTRPVK